MHDEVGSVVMVSAAPHMLVPLLSEADPAVTAEGTIDPLGLYAIADVLAVRLVPGVRERQSHPRYLTAMAVAEVVCSAFDRDAVAADHISQPWQVFEWYMVEGLVRTQELGKEIVGLPGREKAARAIQAHMPLSARSYLKTPLVFGFHGIYRLLARTLDVLDDASGLGETGYRLVTSWEREQGLPGFLSGDGAAAQAARVNLAHAVRDGLAKGATDRARAWDGWEFFKRHLHPREFGAGEREVIAEALGGASSPLRQQMVQFLGTRKGQEAWRATGSERRVHEILYGEAGVEMKTLLDAIMAYETFARLMQDAFDDCLRCMTDTTGATTLADLAREPGVTRAAKEIPQVFPRVSDLLRPFGEAIRFEQNFGPFAARMGAREWADALLAHHRKTQAAKPPNGRAPWLERLDDGGAVVRPAYRRAEGGLHSDAYVHAYRVRPLWSFMTDLGMVGR